MFIVSKFTIFFYGIASYTIRIYCTFRKQAAKGKYFTFLVSKTDLLLLNLFEIPRCHKTCRLQKTKERFVWLIWSSVLLRCHKKMTISRRCFKEKCQPWKERKIGVSWNFHCSEICISNVIWQLIILTRTRNGELPFRPCSTFPLPDIAKITNRTKKENKKRVYFQSELYKGMYIQWKRGTNYIVKTHMLHYRVPDTRTKSHYGTLESHISQVI